MSSADSPDHVLSSRPRLLVSIRSAAEALSALQGGADLIDVKDPQRGPLGAADAATLDLVVRTIAGRRPVSAALGELSADSRPPEARGLAYVKWGLAGWGGRPRWREVFRGLADRLRDEGGPQAVPVAYADWQLAEAPSVDEVSAFAWERPGSVLLLDTWDKGAGRNGRPRTLLDWLSVAALRRLCAQSRQAGVRVAVAGSLQITDIRELLTVYPDWFAVRGAACEGGRAGTVTADRVRALAELLAGAPRSAG